MGYFTPSSRSHSARSGTREMRWDGSAQVWEVFVIKTNEWLGAFDTRAEALSAVRA